MSYIEDVCQPLIDTLKHTAGLHAYQLAGHASNLEFWMLEVRHALQLIDGYEQRFVKMTEAQQKFLANDPTAKIRSQNDEYERTLRMGVKTADSERLRRQIVVIAERLLDRCLTEGLITLTNADDLREIASIAARKS